MLENKYWYRDEYMFFSFAGIHSSKYNLFIENNKDLTIENTIGAQSTFSNAYKQEGTYYLGTSRTQKTFKRKCASRGLTINEYKDMLLWLTPGNTGTLIFDNDKYWGWDVIVDTVGDAKYWNDYGDLVVEFDITFKTIGTYLAHSIYPCIWETINYGSSDTPSYDDLIGSVANSNKFGIPPIVVTCRRLTGLNKIIFSVQDISNNSNNFIYNLLCTFAPGHYNNASIIGKLNQIYYTPSQQGASEYFDENKILYDSYKFVFNGDYSDTETKLFSYDSKSGLLSIDGQLAEENENCNYHKEVNGLLKINTSSPVFITQGTISFPPPNALQIPLTPELYNKLVQYDAEKQIYYGIYDYLCVAVSRQVATQYNDTQYNNDEYTTCYISTISFNRHTMPFSNLYAFMPLSPQQQPRMLEISNLNSNLQAGDKFVLYGGYSNKFELDLQINSNDISLADSNISVTSLNNM